MDIVSAAEVYGQDLGEGAQLGGKEENASSHHPSDLLSRNEGMASAPELFFLFCP